MTSNDANVVIVVAGIAGHTAAWRLSQVGRSVSIIEACDRIGGRLQGFQSGERAV